MTSRTPVSALRLDSKMDDASSEPLLGCSTSFSDESGQKGAPMSPTKLKSARLYPHLLTFEEVPAWCQDNVYIRQGYRPVSGSAAASFRSWLYMHNESMNIYTHMVPAVGFFLGEWAMLRYLHETYPEATTTDYLVFTTFFLSAVVCLSFSTCYHTLTNHSEHVDVMWLKIDFVGILILTAGDFITGIYVGFWCEPVPRGIYWGMISALSAVDVCIMLNPKFQGTAWRGFRTMFFVGTALSGFFPIGHGVVKFGFAQMMKQSGMPHYLLEGALLCTGVVFYATRFPERWYPNVFDIYGSSHQIFHVFVVLATVAHFVGIFQAYDYNYYNRVCPSPH